MPDDPLGNFRTGLTELGYEEEVSYTLELRFARGDESQLPHLISELAALPVDVMALSDTRPIPIAVNTTKTVPLVMMFSSDPVGLGLVQSLARPGGNLTGLAAFNLPLAAKRLEKLRDAVPGVKTVAVLHNPRRLMGNPEWDATQDAAQKLQLTLLPLQAETREELDDILRTPVAGSADALYVLPDVLFLSMVTPLVEFANRNHLPSMFGSRAYVEAGGLMTYVPDRTAMFQRAAYYVDRILKGANPGELPIEQPTRFDFVINMGTARALGLEVPPSVLQEVTAAVY